VRLPRVSFHLTAGARRYKELRIDVAAFPVAVEELRKSFKATPAGPDANILVAEYEDTDPDLVWRVANEIAQRFVSRRKEAQKSEVSSTVRFLRGQLDTLKTELQVAEDSLRSYREREHVISPEVEANDQVSRLITLQGERHTMESERSALAKLLQEVTAEAAKQAPGEPSPYRKLIAFPTLLRNPAASELLSSLMSLQNERDALLTRRREQDPDVQALTARIGQLEEQLKAIGATYLQGITDQVTAVDSSLRGFGNELARLPRKEVDYGRLERQTKVLGDVYTLLQTRLKEAEITEAADDPSVRIIDEATMPLRPSRPRPLINLVAGLGLGLVLGMGVVLGREYLNKTVRARTDISNATGLPVVGLIPRLPQQGKQVSLVTSRSRRLRTPSAAVDEPAAAESPPGARPEFTFLRGAQIPPTGRVRPGQVAPGLEQVEQELVTVTLPPSGTPIAEAYGSLLTNIAFAKQDGPIRTVVFTSALPGDGKTTSAVNLALTLPARGYRVMLIDADMRRGMIHKIFGQPRAPGLSDILLGRVTLEQARRVVEVGESGVLHYLPTGRIPGHPPSLLDSPQMRALLERLSGEYDRIIIDSPPANIVTDAELLGSFSEAVVLVARAGVTETSALAYAAERLRHVGARVIGVVLNDIDPKRDAVYDRVYRFSDYNEYSNTATD
jgi:polysaccharide biosynthesis transport protein